MPKSKLSAFCNHVIEAGWLAAVIVTPLFFSGYTSTVMDADKLALLCSIAAIMIAAWLIKWIEERRSPRSQAKTSLRSPMVLPILFLVGAYLLATLTSIVPRISLFGSYQRAQGTYTLLSFAVVFAMILQGMRTRQQFDRLIVAIILTSLPIALYGIVQKYGLDPLVWSSSFDGRSGSTVGNPIFLGAYLIMVFALTLGKSVASVHAFLTTRQSGKRSLAEMVLAITYTLLAAAQAAAILATNSRGPLLGWFAGIVLFALLLALIWRIRWLILGAVGLGVLGALFLIVLNLPNSPLAQLRSLPVMTRLGNLTDANGEFRLFTWENAARLMLPHAPVQFPDGTPDTLNALRPIVGYGPDAMPLVYTQISPASTFTIDSGTDRSHNATWDAWVTTGLVGLIAYQLLFFCLFLFGFRWLGLIRTDRDRNWFAGLWVGLGATGAFLAIILGQPLYVGVGLPAGNILAIVLYLILFALRVNIQPQANAPRHADQILLAALLAGLFAHYVESQFGIDVPPTQTIFWAFAAVLVVLGTVQLDASPDLKLARSSSQTPAAQIPSWVSHVASYAIIVSIILSTLVFEFVKYEKGLSDPLVILWRGLTFDPVRNSTTYAVLGLIVSVWILAIVLTSSEMVRSQAFKPSNRWRTGAILLAALPIVLTALFALGLAAQLGAVAYVQTPVQNVQNVLTLAGQAIGIVDYYTIALFLLLLMAVTALMLESKLFSGAWSVNKWALIAFVPAIAATLLWVNVVNLNPIRADVVYRLGKVFDDQSDWNAASALYKRAIGLAPANDAYYMTLARAFQQKSVQANTTAASLFSDKTGSQEILTQDDQRVAGLNRLDLLYAAQAMLLRARDLNPLYTDHTINLARFYQPELPMDTASKAKLADLANQYYVEAQRLSPNSVLLWNERADFDLTYKNDPGAAIQKLNESLARDAQFEQTYLDLGKAYAAKKDLSQAIEADQEAFALDPKSAEAQSKLAYLFYQQGQLDESIQAYSKYIELAPGAQNIWEAHKNLALLYEQVGNFASATQEAQVALGLAPLEAQSQLKEIAARWLAQATAP